ncbi:DUF4367 domain-containing protein [Paenibacillus thalictri]|uniref:DUF4367 domain-containing protein n=1 Tax=Paenibacillus thalictri TaxID=2527873 RepID=UPI0013EF363C|nr:DUF4367 domain-containing protein [Paenibacillus thalictri]
MQKIAVQRALFEHYVRTVGCVEPLKALEPNDCRQVLVSAFMEATAASYKDKGPEEIAELLRMKVRLWAEAKRVSVLRGQADLESSQGMEGVDIAQAWDETSALLSKKRKIHSLIRKTGVIAMITFILLVGGIVFGVLVPGQGSFSAPGNNAVVLASQNENESNTGVIGELKAVQVTENELKQYTSFIALVPGYLPAGYRLDEAAVWLHEGQSKADHALLTYINDQEHLLRVTLYKMPEYGNISTGVNMPQKTEEVFVRGSKAVYITTQDDFFMFNWLENGTYISITGRQLTDEEVVKMAKGMK